MSPENATSHPWRNLFTTTFFKTNLVKELTDHAETLHRAQLHTIFTNARALQAYERLDSYSVCRWPPVDWKKQLATAKILSLAPAAKCSKEM